VHGPTVVGHEGRHDHQQQERPQQDPLQSRSAVVGLADNRQADQAHPRGLAGQGEENDLDQQKGPGNREAVPPARAVAAVDQDGQQVGQDAVHDEGPESQPEGRRVRALLHAATLSVPSYPSCPARPACNPLETHG
jgi:hypothetical protein